MAYKYTSGRMVKCRGECGKVTRLVSHDGDCSYACSPECDRISQDPVALAEQRTKVAERQAAADKRSSAAGAGKKSGKKH